MRFFTSSLAAMALWSAAVVPASAIIDATLQMQLGNPSNATADTNNHAHYLIQRTVEAIDYSDTLGEPNWASWDLTASDIGSSGRSPNFNTDTNLPSNFHRVSTSEYSNSGYERGHLCPSADRTDTTNDNDLVFFLSNIMPQSADNNTGVWENFETYCRTLVQSPNNNELLIICGPSGFNGAHLNTNGYVSIPQYTWKVVVVVPPGSGTALTRVTTNDRVICINVPNINGINSTWQNYVTSANQIQTDTGLTFFTALPSDVAAVLRAKIDGAGITSPTISSFTPATGAADTNVTIIGANFTGATAVTFGGANALFTVNSDTNITAVVPTNATSGYITVTTSSGTSTSLNPFTIVGSIVTNYSGVLVGWDFHGVAGFGVSPCAPTISGPDIAIGALTRGPGVGTSGTAAAGGWGGTGFVNTDEASAIAAGLYATFSLAAEPGYAISLSSVSRFDYRRSGTGPASGVVQYEVGSGPFLDLTNIAYTSTSSSGATNKPIDLSGISALQNVGENTKITFRIVNFGGTSSGGTWYIYDKDGTTALDLAIQGKLSPVNPNNLPVPATLSTPTYTNGQFQITVQGTTGTNYVVQASTNLSAPDWISLETNPAPYIFIDTNQASQRFYRAIVAH